MRKLLIIALCLALCACSIIQGTKVEQAVRDALAKDQRTAQYTFEVSRQDDGSIVITGKLFKPEEIDVVTQIASAIPGVKQVVNRCSLEEQGSDMLQDETIGVPYL